MTIDPLDRTAAVFPFGKAAAFLSPAPSAARTRSRQRPTT